MQTGIPIPIPIPIPISLSVLHALLDKHQHLPPEYAEGLSNHLPMALQALHSLGADEQRLRSFADHYVTRFKPWPHARAGQVQNSWQKLRGDISAFADLQATFAASLQAHGTVATLQTVLPDLWPGVAAAAFHGLIRTAHALQAAHAGELASGLAYWAARWQAIAPGPSSPSSSTLVFNEWSDALAAQAGGPRPAGGLITQRMDAVQHTAAHRNLAGRLACDAQTLVQLANFALVQYSRSGNFTVLHMVTASRATGVVVLAAANAQQSALALNALVPAFTAAFLASGIAQTHATEWLHAAIRAWPEIIAAGIQSADDHTVKLVHACCQLASVQSDVLCRQAAEQALCTVT
jgi:Questin oxidase-like